MVKRVSIIILTLLLITAFSTNLAYGYTSDYYEKFYYSGAYYGSSYLYSPFHDSGGAQLYKDVTSKYNNPRPLASSPHGGVDFDAQIGTNAYPLSSGQVLYVNSSIDPDFGKYVVIKVDVNRDGSLDSVYARYAHLSQIYVSQGQNVSTSTLIGLSGNTGTDAAHLHVDLRDNNSTNNGVYHSLPWRLYYSNTSNWSYGRDLDWMSGHNAYGRTFEIYCYGRSGSNSNVAPSEVKLWVRLAGTTNSWTGYSMSNAGRQFYYGVTIPTTDFPSGSTVEYFFSGKRGDINESLYCPYGLYPTKFKAPAFPPDRYQPFAKYTITLS